MSKSEPTVKLSPCINKKNIEINEITKLGNQTEFLFEVWSNLITQNSYINRPKDRLKTAEKIAKLLFNNLPLLTINDNIFIVSEYNNEYIIEEELDDNDLIGKIADILDFKTDNDLYDKSHRQYLESMIKKNILNQAI